MPVHPFGFDMWVPRARWKLPHLIQVKTPRFTLDQTVPYAPQSAQRLFDGWFLILSSSLAAVSKSTWSFWYVLPNFDVHNCTSFCWALMFTSYELIPLFWPHKVAVLLVSDQNLVKIEIKSCSLKKYRCLLLEWRTSKEGDVDQNPGIEPHHTHT